MLQKYKRFWIVSLFLIAAMFFTFSCAPTGGVVPPSAEEDETPIAATRDEQGPVVITVTDSDEITNFSPQTGVNGPTISLINHIYEPLILRGEEGLEAALATDWSVDETGTVYTFQLREGVRFHDGTDFTAEAVKVTFEHLKDPEMQGTIGNNYLGMIQEVEVVDDFEVKITIEAPFGPFLFHLGHPSVGHIVSPTAIEENGWEGLDSNPIGTGPLKFIEWRRGDHVTLEKFDDYWGDKPQYDRLVYKPVGEAQARLAMAETGEVDIAQSLRPDDTSLVEQASNLDLLQTTQVHSHLLHINTKREPFDDVRVRQALNYAVNKEIIVDNVIGGAIVADSPVGPGIFARTALDPYTYDLDKAKSLLEEAGFEGPKSILLESDTRNPKQEAAVQAIANMLEEVGFDVELRFYGDAPLYLETRSERDYDLAYFWWGPFSLDPDALFFPIYHSSLIGKQFNFSDYANPRVDELIAEGRSTVDQESRAEIYEELQEIVWDDAPAIFLYYYNKFSAVNQNVDNVWIDVRGLFWLHDAVKTTQ